MSVTSTQHTRLSPRLIRRSASVAAAVAGALATWVLAAPIAGIELDVRVGGETTEVGPGEIAVTAAVAGLAAWAVLALLERWTANARRIWITAAAVLLVVSLAGPVGSAVGTGAALALVAMHVVVGTILIAMLARSDAPRRR
jgi:hypothetical protein